MTPLWPAVRTGLAALLIVLPASGLTGCAPEPERPDYVARVGDHILTGDDVRLALEPVATDLDSAEAARSFVSQWVTSELLYAEAVRRGLASDPDVRRRIEDSERSVLISALLDELYRNADAEPTRAEVATYFESHRDQLGLLEPFVRVRYLHIRSADSADVARRALARTDTADTAGWAGLAERFSVDPAGALDLSASYVAEGRLFPHLPRVRDALSGMRPAQTSAVIGDDAGVHVLQLVDRVPAGTIPRMEWIEPTLRQRLRIETRKQLYARLVQELRNQAVAREQLEAPD